MILRLTANAEKIVHIPKVLYFWRSHAKSVAMDIGAKSYAISAGQRAVADAVRAAGYEAEVVSSDLFAAIYRLKYKLISQKKISIVIRGDDDAEAFRRCMNSVQTYTTYPDYEIIVIGTSDSVEGDGIRRVASLENAVQVAQGETLVFLSPNAVIVTPEWLEELLMYTQRRDVGAVGPVMVRNDNTLWHTGMILGLGAEDMPGEAFQTFPYGFDGYMGRLAYAQNVSALSADCLMLRKDVYLEVGGFDSALSGELCAADLCFKLMERGYVNVWTPFACLKITPREDVDEQGQDYFVRKWQHLLSSTDPYYNSNFSTDGEGFCITPEK